MVYLWFQEPGAQDASVRKLPPSAIGDSSNFDAMGLLDANKGKPMQAIVEQIRDGSTLRVYLLPDFQFVQVFVAGIQVAVMFFEGLLCIVMLCHFGFNFDFDFLNQSPSMGRRATVETPVETEITPSEANGDSSADPRAPLTSAQRLAASTASITEVAPDPYGREAKHFTEIRVLNRDVGLILFAVDLFEPFFHIFL